VNLKVQFDGQIQNYQHTKGLALSFYANSGVDFIHHVSAENPLACILIATSPKHLKQLPEQESALFNELLHNLANPSANYVEGPSFFMSPDMQECIDKMLNNSYEGKAKMLFFKSQASTLLAHFFGHLSLPSQQSVSAGDRKKLEEAKSILIDQLDSPPSLSELAQQIGLNTHKLKKEFKHVFGVPVFKYLQQHRLKTAHQLITSEDMTVQEAAWHVGYDSLSSFSNAFAQTYGYRPSEIRH